MALLFPFFRNFAIAATHLLQAPTGMGLTLMEDLEVDDASRGGWAAIGLMILPVIRTPGARHLIEQVRSQAGLYQGLAELARIVPPEVLPAMRAGDPACLAGLPENQRDQIQEAARAVAALQTKFVAVTDATARFNPRPAAALHPAQVDPHQPRPHPAGRA